MEGEVFLCTWQEINGKYSCWVTNQPHLRASEISLEAADAELVDKIIEETGDLQPLLQYVPSLPPSSFDDFFRGPDLVAVKAPNELAVAVVSSADLFSEGVCQLCKMKKGSRNAVELKVQKFPVKADSALVNVRPSGYTIPIFSQEFLDLLKSEEQARVDARPVSAEISSKRKFYELICRRSTDVVFVRGIDLNGWKCDECGQNVPRSYTKFSQTAINYFVTKPPQEPCINIFAPDKYFFCIPRRRWEEIVGTIGTKGLAISPIGVVPEHLVDLAPKVEMVSQIIKKYGRF